MTNVIMIVARDQDSLYRYICNTFSQEPEVDVIFDRREGERRRREDAPLVERRSTPRRREQREDLLKAQGWLIVRRP